MSPLSWLWSFGRNYKKKAEEIPVLEKAEQWTRIQKAGSSKQSIKLKGKEPHPGNRANYEMKKNSTMQEVGNSVSSNPFIALCPVEDQTPPVLEEGEVLPSEVLINDSVENNGNIEIPIPNPCVIPILQENLNSPTNPSSSPSYAEILKKKMVDSSGSSNEDTFE